MGAIETATALLKREEGLRLKAYPDPASRDGLPWTIGYGATGPGIRRGTVWTKEQAEQDLHARILDIAQTVLDEVQVPLTENQLAALISWIYNVGTGRYDDPDTPQNEGSGFKGSTLLRLLNQGDYEGAADQLPRWNKAGGRVNPVLVGRRGRERDLFLTPDE